MTTQQNPLYMGIDGGGSNLRIVIVDSNMQVIAQARSDSANPNAIGRENAKAKIQATMREALSQIEGNVQGVGIGIAGASNIHASDWLREVVLGVLPETHVADASDNEIALVGALGERFGLLLLAGTGSVGFGVNAAGEALQVGGWGYLIGDEGSGYWLGNQALRIFIEAVDKDDFSSVVAQSVRTHLKFVQNTDVVKWLYLSHANPVPEVAKLARLVLDAAAEGDLQAVNLVAQAASDLAELAVLLKRRLKMETPPIAFAGGLLTSENALSAALLAQLGLKEMPSSKYEPVIGAALLAKLMYA